MNRFFYRIFLVFFSAILFSCTAKKQLINTSFANVETPIDIEQKENDLVAAFVNDSIFNNAQVGICVYEPATNTYLYNYQSNKYFVPASNVKIATCYAAMKYLGDSLVGLMYQQRKNAVWILPTGDPTFLHPQFKVQPIFDFLKTQKSISLYNDFETIEKLWQTNSYGKGWSWDDYNEEFMPQKSIFPIYGNLVNIEQHNDLLEYDVYTSKNNLQIFPKFFSKKIVVSSDDKKSFKLRRNLFNNLFYTKSSGTKFTSQKIPFITDVRLTMDLLKDTIYECLFEKDSLNELARMNIEKAKKGDYGWALKFKNEHFKNYSYSVIDQCSYDTVFCPRKNLYKKFYSQPTDSLLKQMMHNSDNFFAEQTLLMVSLNKLGFMSDDKMIDTLLKTEFKDLPQKPKWVDGSGLSRYNLFTPQDFIFILNKMKSEFNWQRIATIFPTGDEGTLKGYYKKYQYKIFAKSGTLSNTISLSGFLKPNTGKDLIFSIIVNNHQSTAASVKVAIEKFITNILEKK